MILSTDLFTETWLYKDGFEADRKQAKAEAKAEGLLFGMRHSVNLAFEATFPAAGCLTEVDQIDSNEVLGQLLCAIFKGKTADDVRASAQAAMRPPPID